jgi:hypothetical protein
MSDHNGCVKNIIYNFVAVDYFPLRAHVCTLWCIFRGTTFKMRIARIQECYIANTLPVLQSEAHKMLFNFFFICTEYRPYIAEVIARFTTCDWFYNAANRFCEVRGRWGFVLLTYG